MCLIAVKWHMTEGQERRMCFHAVRKEEKAGDRLLIHDIHPLKSWHYSIHSPARLSTEPSNSRLDRKQHLEADISRNPSGCQNGHRMREPALLCECSDCYWL